MTNHPSIARILITHTISQYLRVDDLICLFVFENNQVTHLTYILLLAFLFLPNSLKLTTSVVLPLPYLTVSKNQPTALIFCIQSIMYDEFSSWLFFLPVAVSRIMQRLS